MKTWTENCRPSEPASDGKKNDGQPKPDSETPEASGIPGTAGVPPAQTPWEASDECRPSGSRGLRNATDGVPPAISGAGLSTERLLGSRPVVVVAVAFAVGIAAARFWGLSQTGASLAIAAAALMLIPPAFVLHTCSPRLFPFFIAFVLCVAAAAFGALLLIRIEKKAVPPPSFAALLDGSERLYRVILQPFPDFYPERTVFPVTLLTITDPSVSPPVPQEPPEGLSPEEVPPGILSPGQALSTPRPLHGPARPAPLPVQGKRLGEEAPRAPPTPSLRPTSSPEKELATLLTRSTPPMGVRVSVRIVLGSWKAGDIIEMPLTLRPLTNFENPGRYDYVAEQARRGIFAHASSKSDILWKPVSDGTPSPSELSVFHRQIDAARQHLRRILKENLHDGPRAAAEALFLGYRNAVPQPMQDRFRQAGVMHLLAISGLHVGLAAWAVFRLTQILLRLLCPRLLLRIPDVHLAWGAGCTAAAGYALLAGMAVPTQRALIMLALAAAALVLYRRPDPPSLLSAAALLILLGDPNHLFRPSFQLSFAAFLGIVVFYRPWAQYVRKHTARLPPTIRPVLRLFTDAFLVSAAATLVVGPLTAFHFHGFSVAGMAANTLVVPVLAFVVLPPGLAALALAALFPFAAPILLTTVRWTLEALLRLIDAFAGLPYAFAHTGPIPVIALVGFYTALAPWMLPWRPKSKLLASTALVLGFSLVTPLTHTLRASRTPFPYPHTISPGQPETRPAPLPLDPPSGTPGEKAPVRLTVFDVGQGLAALIQCAPDKAILVDGGGFFDDSFDIGRNVLAPALWAMGVRRVDTVVLSHDHPDHRNGLRFILETFPVGRYVETGVSARGFSESPLGVLASRRGIPVVRTLVDAKEAPDGSMDLGTVGQCRLRALHPLRAFIKTAWDGKNLNDVSLVLEVTLGNAGILLPGDIGETTEKILLGSAPLSSPPPSARNDAALRPHDPLRGDVPVGRGLSPGSAGLRPAHPAGGTPRLPGKNPLHPRPGVLNGADRRWILITPHHGSAASSGVDLLERLRPDAALVSCGYANPFGFPTAAVLDRFRALGIPVLRTDLHGAVHAAWDGSRWHLRTMLAERQRLYTPCVFPREGK